MSEREGDSIPKDEEPEPDADDVPSVCDVWILHPDGTWRPKVFHYLGEPLWSDEDIAAGRHLETEAEDEVEADE